ncbi:MAG: ATP-binding protein, partial [Bacillota bacterium]
RFEAANAGVAITTDVPQGVVAFADQNQIKQVLINLMLNAIEAMPGPGSIHIEASSNGRGSVTIAVSDSGSGIAKEDLKRVFEPFFTRKPKGTGLGLPVSYRLMQENEGDLRVESLIGQGTTVTLELPAGQLAGGEVSSR